MNDHDYSALEELLTSTKPQAEQTFYLSLRQTILKEAAEQQPAAKTRFSFLPQFRLWQPVAAGVLLIIVIWLLTPAGQTFAQQILRLGVFFVTDNPTFFEKQLDDSEAATGEVITLDSIQTELESAANDAGFPVYFPAYLPEGYKPETDPPIELILNSEGEVTSAEAMFFSADGNQMLFYAQHPFPPEADLSSMPLDVGNATVEKVTVLGNEALWLTDYVWGLAPDETGELQPVEYNVLLWTFPAEDGANYYFWLGSSEKLTQAEMLHIAESLETE